MIPENATFSVQQDVILPHHSFEAVNDAPEPFEAPLRARLHDILEEWESVSNYEDPLTAAIILAMSDQISDALYPPEDSDD